jgi:hypothetical protein
MAGDAARTRASSGHQGAHPSYECQCFCRRLLRLEARRLSELDCPHIVAVYDFVEEAELAYLVTEWVDGETLREMLERVTTLTPEQSLGVLRGALMGLQYAHQRQLVHGDVSPGNLIVDRSGTTKLIDFGLAAPAGESGVSGTPAYLSPEAASGRPLLPASDVYSAAAVLFQLLAGRPVFAGTDVVSVVRAQRDDVAPALEGHGPKLKELLARALAKDPALRPVDAGAFLVELEAAAAERFGAGWLSKGSVASLVGMGGAGTAAGMASTVAAGSTAAATTTTTTGETLAASAVANTGTAVPMAQAASGAGRFGRLGHVLGAHPIVAGAVAVVAVAAVATTAILAASSSKPKAAPEAVLLASSPQGKFAVTGISVSVATAKQPVVRKNVGPLDITITEKCTAKICTAVWIDGKTKRPFTYDGTYFVSSTNISTRVPCPDPKTHILVKGNAALLHEKRVWKLKVTRRAPDTADGPGRALEFGGTETLTQTASNFEGRCVDGGTLVYHFTWTAKAA